MAQIERFKNFARRYPDVSGPTLLLGLVLVVFWPLVSGKALFFGDLELQFYPWAAFWQGQLQAGQVPLWNPLLFGGVPFAGNPQIGLLYPPSLLLLFFPPITALSVSAILHLWGSGTVFFLWMRRGRLRLGTGAALLGAMSWMLGGAFISKTQFPNMLAALSYLPAALWAAEYLAARATIRSAVVFGSVLGLQLLASHAQISLYTAYLSLGYGLWCWKAASRTTLLKAALTFGAGVSLALLLDGGQLLPVLENLRGAERQTLSVGTAPRFVLPVWAVTNFLAPYLYGNPNTGTWTFHGGGAPWETACYLGVVPCVLAFWGLSKGRFWGIVALVGVLLALGPSGGLYLLAFKWLPGVSRFHDSARFLMLASLAFSVLASLGYQRLRETSGLKRLIPVVLLVTAVDLGYYARTFYPLREQRILAYTEPKFIADDALVRGGQARIWTPNSKQTRALLLDYGNYRLRTPEHDSLFPVGSLPNIHMWSGLLEAGGYDPIAPAGVAKRLKALEIKPEAIQFPPGYAGYLGEAHIRLLALWRKKPLPPTPSLHEVYRGNRDVEGLRLVIYRNDLCRPRARLVQRKGSSAQTGQGGSQAVHLLAPGANRLLVEIPQGMQGPVDLEVGDNAFAGWRAFESRREVPVEADKSGSMRIPLEAGAQRRVELVYEPQSYRLGVFISLCALGAVVGLFIATKKPETK
jgi:hypothetical protein